MDLITRPKKDLITRTKKDLITRTKKDLITRTKKDLATRPKKDQDYQSINILTRVQSTTNRMKYIIFLNPLINLETL